MNATGTVIQTVILESLASAEVCSSLFCRMLNVADFLLLYVQHILSKVTVFCTTLVLSYS